MSTPHNAVVILLTASRDGVPIEALTCVKTNGRYVLPGGIRDDQETLFQAAQREFKEEVELPLPGTNQEYVRYDYGGSQHTRIYVGWYTGTQHERFSRNRERVHEGIVGSRWTSVHDLYHSKDVWYKDYMQRSFQDTINAILRSKGGEKPWSDLRQSISVLKSQRPRPRTQSPFPVSYAYIALVTWHNNHQSVLCINVDKQRVTLPGGRQESGDSTPFDAVKRHFKIQTRHDLPRLVRSVLYVDVTPNIRVYYYYLPHNENLETYGIAYADDPRRINTEWIHCNILENSQNWVNDDLHQAFLQIVKKLERDRARYKSPSPAPPIDVTPTSPWATAIERRLTRIEKHLGFVR